jgi:hypothetical protein
MFGRVECRHGNDRQPMPLSANLEQKFGAARAGHPDARYDDVPTLRESPEGRGAEAAVATTAPAALRITAFNSRASSSSSMTRTATPSSDASHNIAPRALNRIATKTHRPELADSD